MAKKVQLMSNPKQWQTIDGEQVLVDVEQHDLDPITDSSCVKIEGHRTLEESVSLNNTFTPEVTETKIMSRVGGDYHENVMDGAYEKAILYGNTQVNVVESDTTGVKYIPHSFTSFQKNEQKISVFNSASGYTNQVAPLMKGATMVNLAQTTSVELAQGQGLWVENVKGNTKYTIMFDFPVQNTHKGIMIQSYSSDTMLEISSQRGSLGERANYTFITHADAVHIKILNASGYGGETIQLDNIMVIEGDVTDLDLPFFKGMRSVELSRPLTNLFTDDLQIYDSNTTSTVSNGNITVTSTAVNIWTSSSIYLKDLLKPNTKYLVMWDSLTATQTVAHETIISSYAFTSNTNLKASNSDIISPTLRSYVFDTGNFDVNDIVVRIHATTSNSETGTTTVTGLRVFEWDDSLRTLDLQTIGYFSGTKNVCQHVFKTESKNLYPYGEISYTSHLTNVDVWFDSKGATHMHGDVAQKSRARFLLKKGTYTITTETWVNITACQIVDDKEQIIVKLDSGKRNHTFTLLQDTYCTLRFKVTELEVWANIKNIQIERGETATTYQGYDGRAYIPDCKDEIILRSLPNGVCDTFNLQTGELVQRIYSHVFDGATYELNFMNKPGEVSGDDVVGGWSSLYNVYAPKHNSVSISCDIPTRQRTTSYDTDYVNKEFFMVGIDTFIISLSKTRLNGLSISQYLTRNPITVQYELDKPIVKTLPVAKQIYNVAEKNVVSMSNNLGAFTCYKTVNNFMIVGNLSPIPAIVEPITHIPYNVRLKENTNYTLKYNRGNSSSMTFDLGGTSVTQSTTVGGNSVQEELLIKTPQYALTHNQLILTGNGYAYNFVIVEGDMRGKELPYFEGINNVKMPIVKNVGKNLFDIQSIYQELKNIAPDNVLLSNDNTLQIKSTAQWHKKDLGKPIKFKENTRYTLSFNMRDIGNSGGKPDVIISFVYTDDTTNYSRDWGDNVLISTAGKTVDYINFSFGYGDGRMIEFSNFMLVEGTEAQPYEPYKENSIYITQGEIPFSEDMFEQGTVLWSNQEVGTPLEGGDTILKYDANNRIRLKGVIPAKPNSQYVLVVNDVYEHLILPLDGNKCRTNYNDNLWVNEGQHIITTTQDTQYLTYVVAKQGAAIVPSDFSKLSFHLYELDSTINLRSLPNGVKDELNLLTGEYIQRVGEVVLDGNQGWTIITGQSYFTTDNILNGKIGAKNNGAVNVGEMIADKLHWSTSFSVMDTNPTKGMITYAYGFRIIPYDIEVAEENIAILKTWLNENPITVHYALTNPIISHVRLVSNNQEREVGVKLPNGVCNTYNPSTGITTVRVGKIVLDGSENWYFDTTKTNTQVFGLTMSDIAMTQNNLYCETMRVASGIDAEIIATANSVIYIALLKTKASTVDELKTYLASNPVTVWYELKYPQIQPDIVLPNGVHDEYNPETGVYTKRVGFIEFDGSGDWTAKDSTSGELQQAPVGAVDMYGVWTVQPLPNVRPANVMTEGRIPGVCDSFSFKNATLDETNEEFYFISASGRFNMNIAKTKLTGSNVSHLKKYLSQNPIKLWYELETPITYQLTPCFGLPQPYAYEDGYLIHDSAYAKTTLPPEFKYKLVANRTGQVMQNNRKLQQHTTRLSNLEAIIIEATIESLFNRELQLFELELMDIQLIDLGE